MIDGASAALDAAVVVVALLAGYAVGSIPSPRPVAGSEGPGWAFLTLTADLAKGVVPVSIGIVTWSWGLGWVAGLGAMLGTWWPAFGRLPGGRGAATTFIGVTFALAPPAGAISVLLGLAVLGAGRLVGRDGRLAATATGIGSFVPIFLVFHQDLARLAALLVVYLAAGVGVAMRRDS